MSSNFEFLFELEKSLHTFTVRSNAGKIGILLSPNFFEIGSSGKMWTRNEIIEILPKEEEKTKIESKKFEATVLAPEIILITYISVRIEPAAKTEFLRSSIWRKNSSGWQMEFHQGTIKK